MRYAPGHREATRSRILDAASRLFRAQGYAATGLDAVMSAAGLTVGAFYSHFTSKDALFAQTLGATLADQAKAWADLHAKHDRAWVEACIDRYLSPQHRDDMEHGCALPSLAAEAARAGEESQRTVEREWGAGLASLEAGLEGPRRAERAVAIFALCVGGIVLSRAVADVALSDRILRACKRTARNLVGADVEET